MFARATTVRSDPARVDQAIASFKERVAPMVRTAPGYAGIAMLVDRDTGDGFGVTYWDTVADLNAAEQLGQEGRRQTRETVGAEVVDVDRFEMVLIHRAAEPSAPVFSRVNQLYADPQRIDETIAFLRDRAAKTLSGLKGYRSLLMGVNRMTGRCVVTSNWETPEDRAGSESAIVDQRRQATTIAGAKDVEVRLLEVPFVEIKQPTRAR
jgi:heme-degrading monooxygenase HmoA